jgi:hypothetical protein
MSLMNEVGRISEAVVLAELAKLGFTVLVPFGGGTRYDLVVDHGNGLARVQVKTGRLINGVIRFNGYSIIPDRRTRTRYTASEVDFFAVRCPDATKVYVVAVSEAVADNSLRLDPVRDGQAKRIKWAKDYELCPSSFSVNDGGGSVAQSCRASPS